MISKSFNIKRITIQMKLKILQNIMNEQNLNFVLVFTELNRFWITNFSSSYGFLLFSKSENKPTIFLDPRYILEGKKKIKNIKIEPINNFYKTWKTLRGKVGIESDLKINIFSNLKKINEKINFSIINFDKLRIIKTKEEINEIKKISKITNEIWNEIIKLHLVDYSEKEIDLKIRKLFLKKEIRNISFDPIVSTGLNSIFIHTKPTNKKITSHLLCDFGGKLNNYCSDFTRTIILKKNTKLKEYYDFVIKVSEEIFKLIKPGVPISKLVEKSNQMYKKEGYEIQHALGHGIGLKVHEYPSLEITNNEPLKEGMVFTIEPGVYIKDVGGVRYENIVIVTKSGYKILTK